MDIKNYKEFKDYYSNNLVEFCERFTDVKLLSYQKILLKILSKKEKTSNIRSERYKQIISVYDIPVQLIRKEDNEIFKSLYLNCYGKIYFFTEDDNVVFMKDKTLEKYKIQQIGGM